MLRHVLAPVLPAAAASLNVPRKIAPAVQPLTAANQSTAPDNTAADKTAADNTAADNTAADKTAADNSAADKTTVVALTFDDGPHPEGTPAVLELLAGAGARATFFVIGEQVERRPALAAEIVAAGHAVALHGYRHRLQLRMSAGQLESDVNRGLDVIHHATGTEASWHRPPYGIYSSAGLSAIRGAGLRPLLWSRWGKDWRRFSTPGRIAARATRDLSTGDVILLHDADFYSSRGSHHRTVQALSLILAELSRGGIGTVLPG